MPLIRPNYRKNLIFILLCLVTAGCGGLSKARQGSHGNLANTSEVVKQLRQDENARSAVETIAESLDSNKVMIKYSPATGKRYSADQEYDPETGVKLLPLE